MVLPGGNEFEKPYAERAYHWTTTNQEVATLGMDVYSLGARPGELMLWHVEGLHEMGKEDRDVRGSRDSNLPIGWGGLVDAVCLFAVQTNYRRV